MAEVDESIVLEDGVITEVQEFSYLGDILGCEGGAERAARVRVFSAWRKRREISGLLSFIQESVLVSVLPKFLISVSELHRFAVSISVRNVVSVHH